MTLRAESAASAPKIKAWMIMREPRATPFS